MSGQRNAYERYNQQMKNMTEPVMPSQLPQIKLDMKKMVSYIRENHIDVSLLTNEDRERIINELRDDE